MTMLDTMRRHREWLKWFLGLVVLAFVVGVVAAVVPAWRAVRVDVLRAIAADG